jgi:hypothetical protein
MIGFHVLCKCLIESWLCVGRERHFANRARLCFHVLSCRVLGRGVEYLMMKRLGEIARDRGVAGIDVHYVPTDRNKPASDFLCRIAPPFDRTEDGGLRWRLNPDGAADLEYRPELTESEPHADKQLEPSAPRSSNENHLERLARYGRTAIDSTVFRKSLRLSEQ